MATLVRYNGGLRRIEFSLTPNGPRQMVRLGRVNAKVAAGWLAKLEAIIADKGLNRPHDPELTAWLSKLDDKWLARLRAAGLADGVGLSQTTLGAFLKRCFDTFTSKPAPRTFYGHTRRNLEEHFGATRLLRDITAADADAWRAWLVEHEKLSPATVARRVIAARTFWRKAVRWKLAPDNPFAGVKAGHQANDARKAFVPREAIDAVLAQVPDTEWQVIIALSRYGGLRCPSEHYALKWGDIDWERGAIRVPCPKLAHIERCAFRTVPLFPELRAPLLKLFGEAEPGTEYVIARHRLGSLNLRQQMERFIARAGLTPWPRLFHNLRASRETELMREYDLATVCRWIGNSPAVAAQHYATSIDLDADFRRAAALPDEAQQKAQQSPAGDDGQRGTAPEGNSKNARENPETAEFEQPCTIADKDICWAQQDSNLRRTDYESAALTN